MNVPIAPADAAVAAGEVEIDGVSAMFGARRSEHVVAVDNVSLRLQPGSFTTLIGPSGCGKSTLLNMVAGFILPHSGSVRVDKILVTAPGPDRGVVFQQYALFPWLTARGNIEFALKRFGLARDERRERAEQALTRIGLAGRGDMLPGQLSGGMKQRLALARTLAGLPKVLLMDEPFGALDAQTRISMHELLIEVWERHKITVLFVTHDVDEALVLSDCIHVMGRAPGRIISTIEIGGARPRPLDATYVANRASILGLLRH